MHEHIPCALRSPKNKSRESHELLVEVGDYFSTADIDDSKKATDAHCQKERAISRAIGTCRDLGPSRLREMASNLEGIASNVREMFVSEIL